MQKLIKLIEGRLDELPADYRRDSAALHYVDCCKTAIDGLRQGKGIECLYGLMDAVTGTNGWDLLDNAIRDADFVPPDWWYGIDS